MSPFSKFLGVGAWSPGPSSARLLGYRGRWCRRTLESLPCVIVLRPSWELFWRPAQECPGEFAFNLRFWDLLISDTGYAILNLQGGKCNTMSKRKILAEKRDGW